MTRVGILQLETFQYLEARHGCEPDAHKWRMDHVALPVLSCSEKFRDCNLRAALIMDTSVASDTSSVFTKWPLAPKLCLRKNALQKLLESQGISYRTLAAIPAEATWDCKNRVCTSCLCFSGAVSRWRFIYMFDTCCILACHCDVVEPNSSWHCRLGKVFVAKGSALNAMYNTREAVGRSRLAQLPRSIWGHCPELGNKGVRISGNATSTSCDFLAYLWHHVASGVNTDSHVVSPHPQALHSKVEGGILGLLQLPEGRAAVAQLAQTAQEVGSRMVEVCWCFVGQDMSEITRDPKWEAHGCFV